MTGRWSQGVGDGSDVVGDVTLVGDSGEADGLVGDSVGEGDGVGDSVAD